MKRARIAVLAAVLDAACSDDGSIAQADEEGGGDDTGGTAAVDDGATTPGSTGPLDPSVDDGGADVSTGGGADATTGGGLGEGGTPGCGVPVDPGDGMVEIDVGGAARTYTIVVPDAYDPNTPTPLVFGWHGRGSDGNQARLYFGIEEAAAGAAIIVYPHGLPIASMGGQTGWDLGPGGIDVMLFDAILQQLSDQMCLDPERIFSTGHSFGGYMSNALGCFRPDVLRAIGPVAGGPAYARCEPGRVAGILIHGTVDQVVPFEQGVSARDALLGRNACAQTTAPVDPDPCVAYDGCDAGYEVHWCEHSNADFMGHAWPSFAGAAIWAFFAALEPEA